MGIELLSESASTKAFESFASLVEAVVDQCKWPNEAKINT